MSDDDDLRELRGVRVSDGERQAVVDWLSKATADGLLTLDEFADTAGTAYAALTREELDAVTRDLRLPVVAPPPAPIPTMHATPIPGTDVPVEQPKRTWVVAIMGGNERKGRWQAKRRLGAFALMGGVDIDLRDALLEGNDVEITAWAIMGGVDITVPEGIPVETSGFVLMGGLGKRIKEVETVPGAPVVRVKGYGMWGGVDVKSKPSKDEERARRAARRAERDARRSDRRGMPPTPPPVPPVPPLPFAPAVTPAVAPAAAPPVGGVATIVCTDIVGSTRMADQLGDQRWREVLMEHNALVREALGRHGGTEVKTSGDGFLLTFPSARSAVRFGLDVQEGLDTYRQLNPELPIEVRIGVHAGEVERDGHDVVGRNVSVASRLCDAAAPGEVLASSVVVDLADSASDLSFATARELQLAGLDRVVRASTAAAR